MKRLYASRSLLNGEALLEWAASHGVPDLYSPTSLHVTIAYSKTPLDWSTIPPTEDIGLHHKKGKRGIEVFGENNQALVLTFNSPHLTRTWQRIIDAGASWDYEGYKSHITLTNNLPEGFDLTPLRENIYTGILSFGKEVFAEIEDDWEG